MLQPARCLMRPPLVWGPRGGGKGRGWDTAGKVGLRSWLSVGRTPPIKYYVARLCGACFKLVTHIPFISAFSCPQPFHLPNSDTHNEWICNTQNHTMDQSIHNKTQKRKCSSRRRANGF